MNRLRNFATATLCIGLLFACDDGSASGVDGNKKINKLTADEIKRLCAWEVAMDGTRASRATLPARHGIDDHGEVSQLAPDDQAP